MQAQVISRVVGRRGNLLEHGADGFAGLGADNIDGGLALSAALLVKADVHHLLRRLEHAEFGALCKYLRPQHPATLAINVVGVHRACMHPV